MPLRAVGFFAGRRFENFVVVREMPIPWGFSPRTRTPMPRLSLVAAEAPAYDVPPVPDILRSVTMSPLSIAVLVVSANRSQRKMLPAEGFDGENGESATNGKNGRKRQ